MLASISDATERSLIGRNRILKMNILPKLLYPFQNIPLLPSPDFFPKMTKFSTNCCGIIDALDSGYLFFMYPMTEGGCSALI